MWRKAVYTFFISSTLAGLGWWSTSLHGDLHSLETSGTPEGIVVPFSLHETFNVKNARRELLEYLDRLIQSELLYRVQHGSFTSQLDSLGIAKPKSVLELFQIKVTEFASSQITIAGFSDGRRSLGSDVVSVNQNFDVRANFELTEPSEEYLKERATSHMKALKENLTTSPQAEETLFKGYFTYSVKSEPDSGRKILAIGNRFPVDHMVLDLDKIQSPFRIPASLVTSGDLQPKSQSSETGEQLQIEPIDPTSSKGR